MKKNAQAEIPAALRRAAGRRTRHALLAAQPDAHAEATAEHHRRGNDAARDGRAARLRGAAEKYVGGDERRAGRGGAARDARVPSSHMLAEPVGRNTAAAIGLAAVHLAREHGDALMAVLPSDSYIAERCGLSQACCAPRWNWRRTPGNLVVLGVPPTRPETGYGYIESGAASAKSAWRRGVRSAPLHRKAGAERGAGICGVGKIFLERRACFSGASRLSWKI